MAYVKNTWNVGDVITALLMNHLEEQYDDAATDLAAKKLDDLATPDDTADLDSTTTEHGLLKKLDNNAVHYMDGQGNWTTPGTKEFFIPATYGTDLVQVRFFHPGYTINAAGDKAFIEFYVPSDFSTIIEVVVVRIALATATHRLNYGTSYGAIGEDAGIHQESLNDQDTAETINLLYEEDISSALSVLAASDHVGIQVGGDAVNVPDDHIIGVRFKYS